MLCIHHQTQWCLVVTSSIPSTLHNSCLCMTWSKTLRFDRVMIANSLFQISELKTSLLLALCTISKQKDMLARYYLKHSYEHLANGYKDIQLLVFKVKSFNLKVNHSPLKVGIEKYLFTDVLLGDYSLGSVVMIRDT